MPYTCSAMAALAKHSYLVNKIRFFQSNVLMQRNVKIECQKTKFYEMRKLLFTFLTVITIIFSGCTKDTTRDVPGCISKYIKQIQKQPKWNPAAEIHEYEYKDKPAYLISAGCCDQYITLIDGQCKYICAPSGGITGKGDGKCADFYETAKHKRLVWKDQR